MTTSTSFGNLIYNEYINSGDIIHDARDTPPTIPQNHATATHILEIAMRNCCSLSNITPNITGADYFFQQTAYNLRIQQDAIIPADADWKVPTTSYSKFHVYVNKISTSEGVTPDMHRPLEFEEVQVQSNLLPLNKAGSSLSLGYNNIQYAFIDTVSHIESYSSNPIDQVDTPATCIDPASRAESDFKFIQFPNNNNTDFEYNLNADPTNIGLRVNFKAERMEDGEIVKITIVPHNPPDKDTPPSFGIVCFLNNEGRYQDNAETPSPPVTMAVPYTGTPAASMVTASAVPGMAPQAPPPAVTLLEPAPANQAPATPASIQPPDRNNLILLNRLLPIFNGNPTKNSIIKTWALLKDNNMEPNVINLTDSLTDVVQVADGTTGPLENWWTKLLEILQKERSAVYDAMGPAIKAYIDETKPGTPGVWAGLGVGYWLAGRTNFTPAEKKSHLEGKIEIFGGFVYLLSIHPNYRQSLINLYVICKELGDTLQAFFLKETLNAEPHAPFLFIDDNQQGGGGRGGGRGKNRGVQRGGAEVLPNFSVENCAFFTIDFPLAARCKLFQIPFIFIKNESKTHYYYRPGGPTYYQKNDILRILGESITMNNGEIEDINENITKFLNYLKYWVDHIYQISQGKGGRARMQAGTTTNREEAFKKTGYIKTMWGLYIAIYKKTLIELCNDVLFNIKNKISTTSPEETVQQANIFKEDNVRLDNWKYMCNLLTVNTSLTTPNIFCSINSNTLIDDAAGAVADDAAQTKTIFDSASTSASTSASIGQTHVAAKTAVSQINQQAHEAYSKASSEAEQSLIKEQAATALVRPSAALESFTQVATDHLHTPIVALTPIIKMVEFGIISSEEADFLKRKFNLIYDIGKKGFSSYNYLSLEDLLQHFTGGNATFRKNFNEIEKQLSSYCDKANAFTDIILINDFKDSIDATSLHPKASDPLSKGMILGNWGILEWPCQNYGEWNDYINNTKGLGDIVLSRLSGVDIKRLPRGGKNKKYKQMGGEDTDSVENKIGIIFYRGIYPLFMKYPYLLYIISSSLDDIESQFINAILKNNIELTHQLIQQQLQQLSAAHSQAVHDGNTAKQQSLSAEAASLQSFAAVVGGQSMEYYKTKCKEFIELLYKKIILGNGEISETEKEAAANANLAGKNLMLIIDNIPLPENKAEILNIVLTEIYQEILINKNKIANELGDSASSLDEAALLLYLNPEFKEALEYAKGQANRTREEELIERIAPTIFKSEIVEKLVKQQIMLYFKAFPTKDKLINVGKEAITNWWRGFEAYHAKQEAIFSFKNFWLKYSYFIKIVHIYSLLSTDQFIITLLTSADEKLQEEMMMWSSYVSPDKITENFWIEGVVYFENILKKGLTIIFNLFKQFIFKNEEWILTAETQQFFQKISQISNLELNNLLQTQDYTLFVNLLIDHMISSYQTNTQLYTYSNEAEMPQIGEHFQNFNEKALKESIEIAEEAAIFSLPSLQAETDKFINLLKENIPPDLGKSLLEKDPEQYANSAIGILLNMRNNPQASSDLLTQASPDEREALSVLLEFSGQTGKQGGSLRSSLNKKQKKTKKKKQKVINHNKKKTKRKFVKHNKKKQTKRKAFQRKKKQTKRKKT